MSILRLLGQIEKYLNVKFRIAFHFHMRHIIFELKTGKIRIRTAFSENNMVWSRKKKL
jgi:hypothetical protein